MLPLLLPNAFKIPIIWVRSNIKTNKAVIMLIAPTKIMIAKIMYILVVKIGIHSKIVAYFCLTVTELRVEGV